MELIKGRVKVEWVELGEGKSGEYNENDPDDEELLRFNVYILLPVCGDADPNEMEWCDPGDASYCTNFPVSATDEIKMKGLEYIMDQVYQPLMAGYSIKKLCERASWISPEWLENETPANP